MQEGKVKRKTYTSSEVKARYNKKHYTQIAISLKKEVAEQYKEKCQSLGIPYSQPLHEAIKNFLGEIQDSDK